MSLSDRLNPATYAGDEVVGVAAVEAEELPGPIIDDRWRYLPEPIWQRLLSLGTAYRLHFSQVAEPIIDTVMEPNQCASLCDELRFLQEVVADTAAHEAIETILGQALIVSRRPSMRLVLSPP